MTKHILTTDDFIANPELKEHDLQIGDEIEFDSDQESEGYHSGLLRIAQDIARHSTTLREDGYCAETIIDQYYKLAEALL